MHVFNSLFPVFLLIAIGKALTRTSFFSDDFSRNLTRLTYWIALPALLLDKITNATFNASEVSRLSFLLILATILSALIAYAIAKLMRSEQKSLGAFVQGSARANNAFVGLPVILYAMDGLNADIEALATIALAPAIVFYNIFSVCVLLTHSERKKQPLPATAKLFLKQLLTNPLLISCVFGLIFNATGLHFPATIQRSLSTLGNATLALALLSIGTSLSFTGISRGFTQSLIASSIKVFIQPLIGLGLALLWHLPPVERQMLLIYLACPTAVASYVLVDIFDSNRELAAHIIVVSTLLSAISLSLAVAFGG
jgi:predicted permease